MNKEELQEQIAMLKKQVAGSKGRNKQFFEENKRLKEDLSDKDNVIKELESQKETLIKENNALKKEVYKVSSEIKTYTMNADWFNSLPWYKKMFVKM